MTLNDYQQRAIGTAVYPGLDSLDGLTYTVLGLTNEAGEAAGKLKKLLRGDRPENYKPGYFMEAIAEELGDALWYIAAAAEECGRTLEEIAEGNLKKLADRKERGVLKGSGDHR